MIRKPVKIGMAVSAKRNCLDAAIFRPDRVMVLMDVSRIATSYAAMIVWASSALLDRH